MNNWGFAIQLRLENPYLPLLQQLQWNVIFAMLLKGKNLGQNFR